MPDHRAAYGGAAVLVLVAYGTLYYYLPVLDTSWFVGSGLFLFSILLLNAVPCLQSALADVNREPDWLETVLQDRIATRVFKTAHIIIVATVITSVFYYWCSRFQGWSGSLPHFEDWDLMDFLSHTGSFVGLAWGMHEVSSQAALSLAKRYSRRVRRRLSRRHIGEPGGIDLEMGVLGGITPSASMPHLHAAGLAASSPEAQASTPA